MNGLYTVPWYSRYAPYWRVRQAYRALRHRTWVVYDPMDNFVLYTGKRRNCYKAQDELYGGTIVCPLSFLPTVVESPR